MRGTQNCQGAMFSDISLEERVPQANPLRWLRAWAKGVATGPKEGCQGCQGQ